MKSCPDSWLVVFLSIRCLCVFWNLGLQTHFRWKLCWFWFCFLSLSFSLWAPSFLSSHGCSCPSQPSSSPPQTSVSGVISGLLLHGDDRDTADPVTDLFLIGRLCLHSPTPPDLQLLAAGARATLRSSVSAYLPKFGKVNSMCLSHHKIISSIGEGLYIFWSSLYTQCIK